MELSFNLHQITDYEQIEMCWIKEISDKSCNPFWISFRVLGTHKFPLYIDCSASENAFQNG